MAKLMAVAPIFPFSLVAQDIDVTYASSGKLYAQIKAGAPYDISLSANRELPVNIVKEITLVPASYPVILPYGIVISDVPIVADFTDYLRSKAGQQYFSQAGYLMVK